MANKQIWIKILFLVGLSLQGCKKKGYVNNNDPASASPAAPAAPLITSPSTLNSISNTSSVNILGSCQDGANVTISGDATNSQICSGSAFSFTVSGSIDAVRSYNFVQSNAAGSSPAANLSWTRDTVAPAALVRNSPVLSPYVSSDSSFNLTGTCEAGAQVNMGGDLTSSITCSAGGNFSHNISKSVDGTYNFSFVQVDAAGNSSTALSFQWIRNSALPPTPTITAPAASPYYSNISLLTVAGTCTAGYMVILGGDVTAGQVTIPAGSLNQTCTGGGTFSYVLSKSSDASYSLNIKQNDGALDSAVATTNWIRDTLAPSAPVITAPASSPHHSTANLILSGSCETAATVNLSGSDIQSMICAGSAFSFTIVKSVDATYNFSVAQTDLAANASASASQQWIRNNTPPAAPTITTPAADPNYSNGSSYTLAGACVTGLTVTMGGDVTAGQITTPAGSLTLMCTSSVYSFVFSKSTDATYNLNVKQTSLAGLDSALATRSIIRDTVAPAAPTITTPASSPHTSAGNLSLAGACVTGHTVNLAGNDTQSITCASNAYAFTVVKSVDATYNFTVAQTDLAGNASAAASQQWIRASAPPVAPVITVPASSPFNSNGSSVTISGTCIAGSTVNLGGAATNAMICTGGSAFSFAPTAGIDNTYTYSVTQTTASGTSSAVFVDWRRDTVAPAAVVITSPTQNPFTSGDTNFNILGTCEPNSSLAMTGSSTGSSTCTAGGTFSHGISKSINGTYNFGFIQTDSANNASASLNFQWVRDTTMPATPTTMTPATNPFYSNSSSLTISGACVTGNTVTLGGNVVAGDMTTPAGALTLTCAGSAYTFILTKTINATYAFNIIQTSPTLVNSAPANLTWVRDTVAPSAPVILNPIANPITASGNLIISGTCETNATVNLAGNDIQSVVCVGNSFTFTIIKAVDATYNFTVSQTDLALNASGTSGQQWIRNSGVPPTPVISSPSASPYRSSTNTLALSGSCQTGLVVTLFGDVTAGQVTSPAGSLTQTCASSSFSFTILKAVNATYNLNIKQTSGGTDSGATSLQWIFDGTAPLTTITANPTNPNLSLSAVFSFTSDDVAAISECKIDLGLYVPCTSPVTYNSLSNASHTFYVRSTDQAGNIEAVPASYTWSQTAGQTVALYHFNSAPGITVDDGSYVNANNLTNVGATSAAGVFSQGAGLASASSQYLSVAHNGSLAVLNKKMTAELRVRMTTLPPNGARMIYMSKMGAAGQMGWELGIRRQGSNYQIYLLGSTDGTTTTEIRTSNLTAGEQTALTSGFNHVAVTWDLGSVKIYLGGVLKISGVIGTAGTSVLFNNSTSPVRIGTNASGVSFLNGSVDEARISQVVRWTSTFAVPPAAYFAD